MGNKKSNIAFILLILIVFSISIISCNNDYQPKPRAYFRIQLPEKNYQVFQAKGFPYSFNIPIYAKIARPRFNPEKYWVNIVYPQFNAQLHISYKTIHHNLDTLLNDTYKMMNKHIPKANAINEQLYIDENARVFGMTYDIRGSEAASPFQFYLTDSTHHFLRGALYFNFTPNNDSLKPIIDFLEADIREMIDSFEWK